MIELNKVAHNPQRPIRLNQAFHSDLAWWRLYLKAWNGTSMLSTLAVRDHEEPITTDASGLWGCGGFWQSHWFQQPWESQEALTSQCIATKEMLHILLSCAIWGKHWHGKHIQFQSDNEAVITALNTKSCKDTSLMHMLRCLFFFPGTLFLLIHSKPYIAGIDNTLADALPLNNVSFKGSQCRQNHDTHPPGTDGATSDPKARLDIPKLDNLVQYYLEQGLSTSTHKTYKIGMKKFDEFCKSTR